MKERYGSETPRLGTVPLRPLTPETSHGFHVIEFARDWLGINLYPWQRWLLIHALELNEDGTYRFRRVFLIVGRQNGKTTLLSVLALWWLFVDSDRFPEHVRAEDFLVIGAAQNLDVAEDTWDAAVLRCNPKPDPDDARFVVPALAARSRVPVRTNGRKRLRLKSGASYTPRVDGRGKPAARVMLDELRMQYTWDVWAALSKTKNAVFNSQLWGVSNAGTAKAIVLAALRDAALKALQAWTDDVETGQQTIAEFAAAGHDLATGWFEWSAPPQSESDPGLFDEANILQANPSVGWKPMFYESIMSDLRGGELEADKRTEILCQWVTAKFEPYLDALRWADLVDETSTIADDSRIVLSVFTSLDRKMTTVSACGYRADGIPHVEVLTMRPGMLWVSEFLAAVQEENPAIREVAVPSKAGPSAEFVKTLADDGWTVHRIEGTPLLLTAGRFKSAIENGNVCARSQPALDIAVSNARTRTLANMPVFDVADVPVEMGPVVTCANALYAIEVFEPPAVVEVRKAPAAPGVLRGSPLDAVASPGAGSAPRMSVGGRDDSNLAIVRF